MFKKPRPKRLDREAAETIGLQALAFLAEDETRIGQFLGTTGIAPDDLGARAQSSDLLLAVLDYISSDESLLLMFAANAGIPPEDFAPALALLSGHARTRDG